MRECAKKSCRLQFAHPQVDQRSLETAYRKFYYPDSQKGEPATYENTPIEIVHQVIRHTIEDLGTSAGWRLLDYGCGTGSLCSFALQHGLRPAGIEPDSNAREVALSSGLYPVYESLGDLLASDPEAQFEVIILWQVVEHLREPWVDLAELRAILRAHGSILVSTPNARCAKARLLGSRWENYRNPTHFYYFTERSLRSVLHRSGFTRVAQGKVNIIYPHHGLVRRALNRALAAHSLQGELMLVARR